MPEYWVVDPEEHIVELYVFDEEGAYALAGRESERIAFRGLPGVAVDLRRVW